MKSFFVAAFTVLALVGCGSDPVKPISHDGIRDAVPATGPQTPPTTANTGVIPPVTAPVVPVIDPFKDFSIYFDLNEFTVSEKYLSVVRRHADYMKKNPAQRASVQGNTDERGSREYNLSLGQKRAEAVKKMLVLEGVKDAQVEAVSLGEEKPKNASHDETAWAENRRSDITYPAR